MLKLMLLALSATVMLSAAAGNDVMAAMESFRKAMIAKDGAALEKLLADDLIYVHSAGEVETKAHFIQSIASGKSIVERFDVMNPTVRIFGNTALVQGKTDLYHSKTNIVHMDVLHVWVNGPNGWRLVARQATRLQPAK